MSGYFYHPLGRQRFADYLEESAGPADEAQSGGGFHCLWAAEVPYIPLPSGDEDTASDRLQEMLDAQLRFVGALARPVHARSYQLRFLFQPPADRSQPPSLRLLLLGKAVSPSSPEEAEEWATQCWSEVATLFPQGCPLRLLDSAEGFRACYRPFPIEPANLVELRREYDYLGSSWSALLAYSFGGHRFSLVEACRVLLLQDQPAMFAITLRPTLITDGDRGFARSVLADIARFASPNLPLDDSPSPMLAPFGSTVAAPTAPPRPPLAVTPLMAEALQRSYLRFLRSPYAFLLRVEAAGAAHVPHAVVSALGADLAYSPSRDPADLTGYRCVSPQPEEATAVRCNTDLLEFEPWGEEPESFRASLFWADEAINVFRIPLPPRWGVPGLPARPADAFNPDPPRQADAKSNDRQVHLGSIVNPRTLARYPHAMPYDDLTRHGLIVGATGSGKTTTCLHLLSQLGPEQPFLVIEPVKTEYRSILHLESFPEDVRKDLRIYSIGDPDSVPLRLNPFWLQPGISVAAHISFLKACFTSAFVMVEPLPMILERCLYEMYRAACWEPQDRIEDHPVRRIPTLADLLTAARTVQSQLGYRGELASNIDAALMLRLERLGDSLVGRVLDADQQPLGDPSTSPIGYLLQHPTIVELSLVGDNDQKVLLMAFLLTLMYEHYQSRGSTDQLAHLTLFEEAHRLLGAAGAGASSDPTMGNPRAAAAGIFLDMLAEIRARGEGIIIAEQIPTKLLPDTIKNTNLKMVHRLLPEDDRRVIGGTMNLTEDQTAAVSTLDRGEAAVYQEGLTEALLLAVPNVRAGAAEVSNEDIRAHMSKLIPELPRTCHPACPGECKWYRSIRPLIGDPRLDALLSPLLARGGRLDERQTRALLIVGADIVRQAAEKSGIVNLQSPVALRSASRCLLGRHLRHLLESTPAENTRVRDAVQALLASLDRDLQPAQRAPVELTKDGSR